MNDRPWYQRSEFWMTLITSILGIVAQKSGNPYVQAVGAAFGGAAPTVYINGRSNIKAALNSPGPVVATTE